jgi:tetratricopeptide (TPR) repeat protein
LSEARVLSNRGILHAYRNELGLAETDLNKALALYRGLESEIAAAQVLHNLGYVSALRGDVPAALRRYDEAARPFAEQGLAAPTLSIDRAELLLSARLLPEARRQIEIGVAALEAAGVSLDLAEARLLLSQIALAEGDFAVSGGASSARTPRPAKVGGSGAVRRGPGPLERRQGASSHPGGGRRARRGASGGRVAPAEHRVPPAGRTHRAPGG